MANAKPKTRHASGTKMVEFLGGGRLMLPSELPTERDVLRHALFLQEQNLLVKEEDRRNYPVKEIMKDVLPHLMEKWQKANAQFKPPIIISEQTILSKLNTSWELCSDIVYGKANKKKKEKAAASLDRLFDILKCKCKITNNKGKIRIF